MGWSDDTENLEHSTLSLEFENEMFNTSDSNTNTICLSDLTAPRFNCPCFRRHKKFHNRSKDNNKHRSSTQISLDRLEDLNRNGSIPKRQYAVDMFPEPHRMSINATDVTRITRGSRDESASHTTDEQSQMTALKLIVPERKAMGPESPFDDKSEDSRCTRVLEPFVRCAKSVQINKLRRFVVNTLWTLVTTVMFGLSLAMLIQCGSRVYVFRKMPNSTDKIEYLVKPPSFTTLFATSWMTLIYPLYLLANLMINFEVGNFNELFITHMTIVASEQPTVVKVITRCSLLSILWQLFLNCFFRSLQYVSPIDCAAIMAVMPCFHYLLCWVIVHRTFCALRVIAFILASSGVILNIYSHQLIMWYKVLISTSVVAIALFLVILKRIISRPTFGQFAAFYFCFGIFNLLVFWPLFVITSVITASEPIDWHLMPWIYCTGVGVSLLVYILSMDMSTRKVTRALRTLQPLAVPPMFIAYRLLWLQETIHFDRVWTASYVLIAFACLLNALPNKLLKAMTKMLKRNRSPKSLAASAKRVRSGQTTASTIGVGQTNSRASLVPPVSNSRPNSAGQNVNLISASMAPNHPGVSAGKTRTRLSSVLLRASTSANITTAIE